ncbi:MAG: hypothetical protein ACRCTD_10190 [Beijerinckiaceae bacterium]
MASIAFSDDQTGPDHSTPPAPISASASMPARITVTIGGEPVATEMAAAKITSSPSGPPLPSHSPPNQSLANQSLASASLHRLAARCISVVLRHWQALTAQPRLAAAGAVLKASGLTTAARLNTVAKAAAEAIRTRLRSAANPRTPPLTTQRITRATARFAARHLAMPAMAAALIIMAGAVLFAGEKPAPATAAIETKQPETVASISQWVRLSKPLMLYSIDAPEFARLPQQHHARRHATGNGREDRFTVGQFETDQLYYAVRLYRPGGEKAPDSTLYIDTVRRAADDGMTVVRVAATDQHRTKFGPAAVADAQVQAHGQDGEKQRACLTFRIVTSDGMLTISGLACGQEKKPVDRAMLTCFIDRIALMASGDDAKIRQIFSDAELSRHAGCTKSSLTSVGRKATWLDIDGAAPAFKSTVAQDQPMPNAKGKRKKKTAARTNG